MNGFWNLYATCYDTLTWLAPYRELLDRLVERVGASSPCAVLDAGCGTGNLALRLLERAPGEVTVLGVDASPAMLARARRKARGRAGARFQAMDLARDLPLPSASFHRAVCNNVLYAVPDPLQTLRELHRVLRPGGVLVLSTPCKAARMSALLRGHLARQRSLADWLLTGARLPLILAVHVLNLLVVARGRRRVYHFLERDTLLGLLDAAGFRDVEVEAAYAGQNWLVTARRGEDVQFARALIAPCHDGDDDSIDCETT